MDRIDKFVYINLDKRPDRNEHILKELARFGIPEEKILRIPAVESEKGAYGCAMSHMKAAEAMKLSGDKVWCILEDDHYFTKTREETDTIVNIFLDNSEYDVFLGCFCALRGYDLSNKILRRATKSCITSFYIVKNNVCDALIASNKQSARTLDPKYKKRKGTPCDMMWDHIMKVFYFVAPYKVYGSQILNHSDIKNKVINYSTYVGTKVDREL
jgi:glycosyl transferase family 25